MLAVLISLRKRHQFMIQACSTTVFAQRPSCYDKDLARLRDLAVSNVLDSVVALGGGPVLCVAADLEQRV